MPARFHFDIENGAETLRDANGVEAGDLDEAIEQAELAIEELRDTGALADDEGWTLIIRDERGKEVWRLPV